MFGVLDDTGVLLGAQVCFRPIGRLRLDGPAQLGEQSNHFILASRIHPTRGLRVILHVLAVRLETLKGPPRARQARGSNLAQISKNLIERVPQAVDVQPIKADLLRGRHVGIVSLGDLAVETGDDELAGNTLEAVSQRNRYGQ